jgi:phosphatidylethanolamine-binding protein (PEBP) family uncharacterized protein
MPVIDDFLPILNLKVEWSKKSYASLGNTLKPKKLQEAPSVSIKTPETSPDVCGSATQLVVTLTDPDAPSRDDPKWSEMCHWIAACVAASPELDPITGRCPPLALTTLDEVMPYKPPGPPEKTGKHRYVFLVFAPANGTTDELHLSKPSDRQHWGYDGKGHGVRDWAHDNELVPIGAYRPSIPVSDIIGRIPGTDGAIAANFIYAQNKKQ